MNFICDQIPDHLIGNEMCNKDKLRDCIVFLLLMSDTINDVDLFNLLKDAENSHEGRVSLFSYPHTFSEPFILDNSHLEAIRYVKDLFDSSYKNTVTVENLPELSKNNEENLKRCFINYNPPENPSFKN